MRLGLHRVAGAMMLPGVGFGPGISSVIRTASTVMAGRPRSITSFLFEMAEQTTGQICAVCASDVIAGIR